jgi:hypothetical protein
MSLLDYRHAKTRRTWRIAAAIALAIGILGFVWGHALTQEVYRTAVAHRDALHSFAVMDKYFVAPGLGLRRNLVLMLSTVVSATAAVILAHREIRWFFWDRYLPQQ